MTELFLRQRRRAIPLLLIAALLAACTPSQDSNPPRIFIVRHAEKLAGPDPQLSPDGAVRAARLAELLKGEGIRRIFTTDTRRTRATAAPLARALGVTAEIYAAETQAELAAALMNARDTVLVVGHSNTIAEFAAAFGVDAGAPVDEATEYDRMYVVTLRDGEPRVEIRRYGE
jgi:probable phosphoglycerate mutase